MSKQIDAYSFALGVCEAFCEVVRAGVKRIALSHPFTEDELQNVLGADFLPACEAVARKYGCKAYYLKEPLITDLFPVSLNSGKQNVVFYREDTRRLARVNEQVKDRLILIPRIYTNKPRTTGEGYKGMLHQPDPDKAPDLLGGIIAIRKMHMRAIEETGLTCADEMLYPENRSYLDDLLSYEAIGARSVENQQHLSLIHI